MKISIGNDHAGPDYKKAIVEFLEEKRHTVYNHGTDTFDSVDYPDFVANVADAFNRGGTFATNATCKLMGFEFLYFLLSIDEKKMRSLITDMSFLAQKKNIRGYDTFGPFIKIS